MLAVSASHPHERVQRRQRRRRWRWVGEDEAGAPLDRSVTRIDYPHIPIQTLTPKAQVKLVRFEMKRAFTRIGYIPGAGDEVPAALRQVGYK